MGVVPAHISRMLDHVMILVTHPYPRALEGDQGGEVSGGS